MRLAIINLCTSSAAINLLLAVVVVAAAAAAAALAVNRCRIGMRKERSCDPRDKKTSDCVDFVKVNEKNFMYFDVYLILVEHETREQLLISLKDTTRFLLAP